jgi:hypothetical protein
MNTITKAALAALCALAIAWPLLAASKNRDSQRHEIVVHQAPFTLVPQPESLW